jgi:NADH-quinone oxidoreductase subunit L
MPLTAAAFVVGTLSLAGIPLFAGFASKEAVLGAVFAGGLTIPFWMLLGAAFLTAFYMTRVVVLAFWGVRSPASGVRSSESGVRGSASGIPKAAHAHDPGIAMRGTLGVLTGAAMGVGLLLMFHHPPEAFEAPGWLTPAAVGVATAGILAAYLTYQTQTISADALASIFAPIRYAALRRFWLDDLYEAIYRYVLLAFSRLIGWLDRYIVDGVLNVISAWTIDAGDALRRFQTGRVQDYVVAVGVGVLVLLLWLRGTL